jgi:hypothetical protein
MTGFHQPSGQKALRPRWLRSLDTHLLGWKCADPAGGEQSGLWRECPPGHWRSEGARHLEGGAYSHLKFLQVGSP